MADRRSSAGPALAHRVRTMREAMPDSGNGRARMDYARERRVGTELAAVQRMHTRTGFQASRGWARESAALRCGACARAHALFGHIGSLLSRITSGT